MRGILLTCIVLCTWGCCWVRTHRAALPYRNLYRPALACVLTEHVLTKHAPRVTHTCPARLRVPPFIVGIQLAIFCTGNCEIQNENKLGLTSDMV